MSSYSDILGTISAMPTIVETIAELASWLRIRSKGDEQEKTSVILKETDRMKTVIRALTSLGLIIQDYNQLIFISHGLDDHTDSVIKNELRYLRGMSDQGEMRRLVSTHVDELLREANKLNDFLGKPKYISDKDKGKIDALAKEARDSLLRGSSVIRSSRTTLSHSNFEKVEESLKDAAIKLKEILDTSNESSNDLIKSLVRLSFQTSGA
jgi:hypothetical protein